MSSGSPQRPAGVLAVMLLDSTPVDGVLLAGDLYDKPVPPAEAVRLLEMCIRDSSRTSGAAGGTSQVPVSNSSVTAARPVRLSP